MPIRPRHSRAASSARRRPQSVPDEPAEARPHRPTPIVVLLLAACAAFSADARGVSPYLPLGESPEIERMAEQVLILAGQPIMTRPIAAAAVLDALPKACERDEALCERVRHYLAGFEKNVGLGCLSLGVAAASNDAVPLPNRHGMKADSSYEAAALVYWQPSDYLLVDAGGVAYEGGSAPTGSLVSLGTEKVQLDVGYRDHWLSPMTDSAMLLGTQAETMPSVTLSNYTPMTRLGLRYEVFLAEMSESKRIAYQGGFTTGRPRLAGLHLSIEPFPGFSLGVSRLMQYGGGARNRSTLRDLLDAFYRPSTYDNTGTSSGSEFGNQVAAVTSSYLVSAPVPFAVYFEYAGEDTSTNSNFRLGNSALSAGIHFPELAGRFDLTLETSEWQNAWYVHHIYQDGLTNKGDVIGHWGADWRAAGDGVGARSLMARIGWQAAGGALMEVTYRTLDNASYTAPAYERAHDLDLRYSRRWKTDFYVGAELDAGRDSLGETYSRLGAFLRF